MPQPLRIYLLDPKQLSPETIAVTFAKTSRSPLSFQEIADELNDEKSADFHEKWVVGYGHSSVAEHAVLHIAVENLSRLAVECLESNRLAAYTEKSSRYQIWDDDHFYLPTELSGSPLKKEFVDTNKLLFRNYHLAFEKISEYLKRNQPKTEDESQRLFDLRIRTCSADVCRYYLPASALANVGISINARALEHALVKMLSHNLAEVRQIGRVIKDVAQANVPTLVKYANENVYIMGLQQKYSQSSLKGLEESNSQEDWFKCVDCSPNGQEKIFAALYYRFGRQPFSHIRKHIDEMDAVTRKETANDLLGILGDHDTPVRELEYANILVDVILDQGAYFELKRHRMMTQTPQQLSIQLGFAVPSLFEKAGVLDQFLDDMERVKAIYQKLHAINPSVAAYIVPNAFNRRLLLQMNLRSALHLIRLRSAPNAHFAIRRFALRLADEISQKFPVFSEWIYRNTEETWQSISGDHFFKLE